MYVSLFYVNYVHGFLFSMQTNENFKYAKKIFLLVYRLNAGKTFYFCNDSFC